MTTNRQKPNAIQKATRKAIRDAINNNRNPQPAQPIEINLTIPIKIDLNFFF